MSHEDRDATFNHKMETVAKIITVIFGIKHIYMTSAS